MTMTKKVKAVEVLKCCPWCGTPAKFIKQRGHNFIYCPSGRIKCPVSPNTRHWSMENWEKLVKLWNTRAKQPTRRNGDSK